MRFFYPCLKWLLYLLDTLCIAYFSCPICMYFSKRSTEHIEHEFCSYIKVKINQIFVKFGPPPNIKFSRQIFFFGNLYKSIQILIFFLSKYLKWLEFFSGYVSENSKKKRFLYSLWNLSKSITFLDEVKNRLFLTNLFSRDYKHFMNFSVLSGML